MMCINMEEVLVLIEFFKQNADRFRRGAQVLLERIEDFDAVNQSMISSQVGSNPLNTTSISNDYVQAGADSSYIMLN